MAESQPGTPTNAVNGNATNRDLDHPRGYTSCTIADATSLAFYLCGFCEFVLRLPCQVECGHQFCEACLQHKLQVSNSIECPLCAAESERSLITPEKYQPDFACRKKMLNLNAHCENRDAGCPWQGKFKELDAHLESCDHAHIECTECHEMHARGSLQGHLQNDCLGATIDRSGPCMFGCQNLPHDINIEAHNNDHCVHHVNVILGEINKMKKMRNRINRLSSRVSFLSNGEQLERHEEPTEATDARISEISEHLKKMELSTKTSTNLINVAFKEVQRVAARLVDLERMFQGQFIGPPSGELPPRQQELNRLSEQLASRTGSYDGILLWEISDVERKIEEAKREGAHLNSPVFYTSAMGYNLMARMYLNGDGTGKNHHISLFVVVVKGKFDGALTWPLKQLVHFTLFDQSGNREHHKYTFCTDPSSSSFARPRQAANIASGCPQFISLQEFNRLYDRFIQDDTMILEMKVESGQSPI